MLEILYFTAKWCQPCISMAPTIHKLKKTVDIETIDVEQNVSLVTKYGIRSIPTFIFLKEGFEVLRKSGSISEAEFKHYIKMLN